MTEPEARASIRRILVALDASGASLAALDAAAQLAATLEAEIEALFVEDVDLLHLAGLPFAREAGVAFAPARRMASADMERALRAQAARAQRALEQAAARVSVRCTFRVERGPVAATLLAAAAAADLVAVGLSARPAARGGRTARVLAAEAPRHTLVLPHGETLRAPVIVIYDGTAAATRALTLAATLAQAEQWPLIVWIACRDEARYEALREDVAAPLRGAGVSASFRWWQDHDAGRFVRESRRGRGGTLVLPASLAPAERERLTEALERAGGAVLLVR